MTEVHWKIWIDTGGTFTDCIGISPEGTFRRLKIPSNSALKGKVVKQIDAQSFQLQTQWPVQHDLFKNFNLTVLGRKKFECRIVSVDLMHSIVRVNKIISGKIAGATVEISSGEEVPVLAARFLTETPLNKKFPLIEMKLGSTKGTNAILERKGARTGLIITKGFKDLLLIGTQQRPDLFALNIQKELPLYDYVYEIDERIESDGAVLRVPSTKSIQELITSFKKKKIESVAIAFLNSYKNPTHEIAVQKLFVAAGFKFVCASHALSGQIKFLPRTETTVANAYLAPIIHNYLGRITAALETALLKIMTSAGGLIQSDQFFPKDSLLSGPAGGVVGAATAAKLSGHDHLITFDMGGTSTDVSLYNGRFDYRYESHVGNIKILSPSLAIETIAAGGGSICAFDGFRFTVGPQSAGASPGPACYGAGGPLTITDVNLLLGKINVDQFSVPLHREKAEAALSAIMKQVNRKAKKKIKPEDVLNSFLQIANEKMAEAIKKVSVQQGHNPADFTLLCFGGAGGQHACALAQMLNIKKILIPYDAGLLSAYGIGHARIERFAEKLILKLFEHVKQQLDSDFHALYQQGLEKLSEEGFSQSSIRIDKQLTFLRFKGQESSLEIEYENSEQVIKDFQARYESIFGHWLTDREIEIESIRLIVSAAGHVTKTETKNAATYQPAHDSLQKFISDKKPIQIKTYVWENLKPGASIEGPAIVGSQNSTTVVEDGWQFMLDEHNNALLKGGSKHLRIGAADKAASIELFSNRFTAVAQEMGAILQRTSFSVNVKERLDFSCAVLDAQGYLVVNAPHIPVHLGSLGVCVRDVQKVIAMEEGDVIITNHPGFGGSHLPDVTLIKPVYFKKQLIGYVANRAHHAEIGGKKPGSMPADATRLQEEGVIIAPTYLVRKNKACWEQVKSIFTNAKYPTRLLEENLADLNGALASVNLGERSLQQLCESYGANEVTLHMNLLKQYAADLLANRIRSQTKKFHALERLDDGARLSVKIESKNKKLIVDFTGSSTQHAGNLNATKAIVQSVVLYCLRLWVDKPIAMNEGLLQNVKIVLPHGLLNPDFSIREDLLPAVVGGNTEISQRLTDTLLKALKLSAGSQGTMNNFLFGNERFGYYETIGGGTGAGKGFDGADAVHSHMTNTRITDPEILEHRYPVRLEQFSIRKKAGGKGKWRGGNGIVRVVTFKEAVEINILSQHRKEKPYGVNGGESGKTGNQYLVKPTGTKIKLKGVDSIAAAAGDSIHIETPGGGGWG